MQTSCQAGGTLPGMVGSQRAKRAVWRRLAERVGFEPTCPLRDKTLSRRPRYDHFGTSPFFGARRSARTSLLAPVAARPSIKNPQSVNPQSTIRQSPIENRQSSISMLPPPLEEALHQLAALPVEHSSLGEHPVIERRMLVRAHR
jgi:hypothetical protein